METLLDWAIARYFIQTGPTSIWTSGNRYNVKFPIQRLPAHPEKPIYGMAEPGGPLENNLPMRYMDRLGNFIDSRGLGLAKIMDALPLTRNNTQKYNREFGLSWARAAASYGPYMAAKGMTRDTYANEQMNNAIGYGLDSLLSGDFKGLRYSANEIFRTMTRTELRDPPRQAALVESHRLNPRDNSPRPKNISAEDYSAYVDYVRRNPDSTDESRLLTLESRARENEAVSFAENAAKRREHMAKREKPQQRPASWRESSLASTPLFNGVG